jgi:hypothetical protein
MRAFLFLTAQSRRLPLEVLLSMVLVAVMEVATTRLTFFPGHTAFLFLTAQSRRLALEVLLSMVLVALKELEATARGLTFLAAQ